MDGNENLYGELDAPEGPFVAIESGEYHSCALQDNGSVECWGRNDVGQSDAIEGVYKDISIGPFDTCAFEEGGDLRCWGSGNEELYNLDQDGDGVTILEDCDDLNADLNLTDQDRDGVTELGW